MTEHGVEWRPVAVDGLEDRYEVSNTGLVRRIGKDKPMSNSSARNGYSVVNLTFSDSRQRVFYTHRLVALTFLGVPDGYMECCHWDGNRLNNHVSNLRWDTKSGNAQDAIRHGTAVRGSNHFTAKLNEYSLEVIWYYIRDGLTDMQIARRFKVSDGTIRAIRIGKTWRLVKKAA